MSEYTDDGYGQKVCGDCGTLMVFEQDEIDGDYWFCDNCGTIVEGEY